VLEASLGDSYHIIEAGEPGRTTISDLEIFGEEDAMLSRHLNSGSQVDLVILMLGTNDIIVRPAQSAADITSDLGVLVGWVQAGKEGQDPAVPQVLILSPPHLEQDSAAQFAGLDEIMVDKSHQLSEQYQGLAEEKGCAFFDAAGVIRSSSIDGVHLDADAHITLGQALTPICRKLLA
jgi:lysophospholipase L1-like esterase